MRKSFNPIVFGVFCLVVKAFLAGADARAGSLYQTGFEPPTFTAGQPVDGQESWVAIVGSAAGIITTNEPASGVQALQVDGRSLEFFSPDGLYEGVYSSTNLFDARLSPKFLIEADVRLDGPQTTANLINANLFVANTQDLLAQSNLSSDGHLYGQTTSSLQQFGAASLGMYHHLSILLDITSLQETYYLDGNSLGTLPIPSSVLTDPNFVLGVGLIAAPDTGSFSRANYTAHIDNVSITAVPEPSASVLLVTGITAFACAAGVSVRSKRAQSSTRGSNGSIS